MKNARSIAFGVYFGMIPTLAGAQTPIEVGLVPQDLVVAGLTPTTAGLVVDRLDDQDVGEAWTGVLSARSAFNAAQSACLASRIALQSDPSDTACQEAESSAQSSLQSLRAVYLSEIADFEELLFDQVDGSLLTELRRVRSQHGMNIPPEMLALDWEDDEMAALASAIIEERRCLRRQEEVGAASVALLANARSDPAVVTAASRLGSYLAGMTTLIEGEQ
mgnify:CR=1 FL=1